MLSPSSPSTAGDWDFRKFTASLYVSGSRSSVWTVSVPDGRVSVMVQSRPAHWMSSRRSLPSSSEVLASATAPSSAV